MRTKSLLAMATVVAALPLLAGCGAYSEAHDYNAPAPTRNIVPTWVRIEDPYHYNAIIRTCVGKDGIYIDLANDNSVTVATDDPDC